MPRNKWKLPPKQQGKQLRNQPTQNPTADRAKMQLQAQCKCRQRLARKKAPMIHTRFLHQRRYRLSTLRAAAWLLVREPCLTLNRSTINEGRPTVLSVRHMTSHPRRSRLWKYIAWNENLSITGSSCPTPPQQ